MDGILLTLADGTAHHIHHKTGADFHNQVATDSTLNSSASLPGFFLPLLLFIFLFSLIHLVKIRFPCESELQMHHLKLLSFFFFYHIYLTDLSFHHQTFPAFAFSLDAAGEKSRREGEKQSWATIHHFCFLLRERVTIAQASSLSCHVLCIYPGKRILKTPSFWPWKVLVTIETVSSNKGLIHDVRLILQETWTLLLCADNLVSLLDLVSWEKSGKGRRRDGWAVATQRIRGEGRRSDSSASHRLRWELVGNSVEESFCGCSSETSPELYGALCDLCDDFFRVWEWQRWRHLSCPKQDCALFGDLGVKWQNWRRRARFLEFLFLGKQSNLSFL